MGVKSQLETDYDFEIVSEFFNHFDLSVESMELLITQLDKVEYYGRNVNELFRIFHNIKSATAYLHIRVMNKFMTDVEELLEVMRAKVGPADDTVIDWLLLCSDQMVLWNDNMRLDEFLVAMPDALFIIPKVEYS